MPVLSVTDDNLIALILKKDQQAIEFFYDRYSPVVYGLICSWLPGPSNIAEQILFDVFIGFYHQLKQKKRAEGGLFICLYRLTRSAVIESKKLQSR